MLTTMRDTDRIERIRTEMEARVEASACTARMRRFIRKDFYIVTAKMFLANHEKVSKLTALMRTMETAVEKSKHLTSHMEDDASVTLECSHYYIRLISPLSQRLLKAVLSVDRINAILVKMEVKGKITRQDRLKLIVEPLKHLEEIKTVALDLPPPLTKEQRQEAKKAQAIAPG